MMPGLSRGEHRLHPLSCFIGLLGLWPFLVVSIITAIALFQSQFSFYYSQKDVPFIVLFIGFWLLVVVVFPVLHYFTFSYRIGQDRLIIRSGIFSRTRREVPFTRIHNVMVAQNLWQRLLQVAELRLESAAGTEPEAHMQVLALEQALALEQLIRGNHTPVTATAPNPDLKDAPAALDTLGSGVLLRLPLAEQVRLAVISGNVGLTLLACGVAIWRVMPEKMLAHYGHIVLSTPPQVWLRYLPPLIIGILAIVVVMKAFAIVGVILYYYDFKLSEAEQRLTVERGLLSRQRSSVARRRIQSWIVYEGILHRWLGRRQMQVDIASVTVSPAPGQASDQGERNLVPLAPVAVSNQLVQHCLPHMQWPVTQWQPVAVHQFWRLCLPMLPWLGILTALAYWQFGSNGLWLLLWLPWSVFKAYRQTLGIGWAVDGPHGIVIRSGWLQRSWQILEADKLQALQLRRSPLDRLMGTATLFLDHAGALGSSSLQLPFLPYARANKLLEHLCREAAKRQLRW